MDKLSVRVLRYLSKQSEPASKDLILKEFGNEAAESIRYLEQSEYIKSGKTIFPHRTLDGHQSMYISNQKYEIASKGLDFLQSKPGRDFDRWINRISILASVLGGALLSKPLWAVIDWFLELLSRFSK